jgi:hypothetical protein
VDRVGSILCPVPVRLIPGVTTLVAECLLIGPGKVSMPADEVSLGSVSVHGGGGNAGQGPVKLAVL